ncbi:hypothetical protein [Phytoactinopolyspora endophytica]|uniref:hypothetical protein n=1 Tax=Phytoactinopolyspora endophytica TaxID=1642495 RepID=UPI00101BB7CE|nr:hypothetical protein [Phytoactinopolyspora endophytica]
MSRSSSEDTASPDTSTGMTRIGCSPAVSSLPLILVTGGITALILAVPTSELFGDAPLAYLLALACWLALIPGGIFAGFALAYRPIAVDLRAGTARLGRTTVPLASVTRAWRQTSVARTSTYLSYRFQATGGAWGRVHIAGEPLKRLSDGDRRSLEQFIDAAGIEHPADDEGLSPEQRLLADVFSEHGTKSPAGKRTLVAELRGQPLPDPWAVLAWLRSRDSGQVIRGLPPRLVEPFDGAPPDHHLTMMAAWLGAVLGMGCLIGAPVILLDDELDISTSIGLAVLGAGVICTAIAVALAVRDRRAKRRQNLLWVRLGGQRLMAEDDDLT